MTVRNVKTLNSDVDKAELLALLLDVLMAAEAKRQMFEGVSSAHPYDILQQQIRLLRLRNRARGHAPTASSGTDREFPYAE